MRQILGCIAQQATAFSEKPLFAYLRDTRIQPRQRLTFIPHIAHFVLTFADLRLLLIESPPRDHYQELINEHVAEEHDHWKWFLSDLTAMEMDPMLCFTDALRIIWSDSTIKTRRLSYQMCKLTARASSLHKLVMLLSVEGTAKIAFEAAASTASEVEAVSGRKLAYFGRHHLDAEQSHAVGQQASQRSLETISVPDSERADLQGIVDDVFRHFGEFVDESFLQASAGHGFAQVSVQSSTGSR